MKLLTIPTTVLLLSGGLWPREESLIYAPEADLELTRTFEANAEYDIVFSMEVEGEELELGEQPDFTSEWNEHIVVSDEILEVEDGRPTDLRRTYDELSQTSTDSDGEDESERGMTSDFEGETVRFLWDDEDEEYTAKFVDEDTELDEDLLQWLHEDMDLRAILPGYEVEEGDSWDIDQDVYLPLMWPGGLLEFYPDDADGPSGEGDDRNQQTIDNLAAEGTATFEEVREDDDGRRLAVITVELSITTSTERTREEQDPEGNSVEVEITEEIERELEGEILWDIEGGHLYSVELEGDSEWVQTEAADVETPEGTREVARLVTTSGEISYSVEIEAD